MAVVAKGWESLLMKLVAQKNTKNNFFALNVEVLRNWKSLTFKVTKILKCTCSPNVAYLVEPWVAQDSYFASLFSAVEPSLASPFQ